MERPVPYEVIKHVPYYVEKKVPVPEKEYVPVPIKEEEKKVEVKCEQQSEVSQDGGSGEEEKKKGLGLVNFGEWENW